MHPTNQAFLIEPGWSAQEVVSKLKEAGLTKHPKEVLHWLEWYGIDRRLIPGVYFLHPASPWSLAMQIHQAKPLNISFVLLPGMDIEEIEANLGPSKERGDLRKALLNDANFPEPLRVSLPKNPELRVAFLFPETYHLTPSCNAADELVRLASSLWWEKLGAKALKVLQEGTFSERAILASIVEKEAKVDEERPLIAGVFLNRLNRNMPLESCATVVYAWKLRGKHLTTLNYTDLKIDSTYNTYKHNGFPPAPLGVPSKSSWEAALAPQRTDYLYFVARGDGRHFFSRTYEEHLEKTRAITKRETERGK